jgi:hypothetical protein
MSTVGIIDFELSSGRNQRPIVLMVELASRPTAGVSNLGWDSLGFTGVACVLNMIDKRGERNIVGVPSDPAGTIVI